MTSALLCAQAGIDNPETFANSASYIASWLTALDNDHKLVITAAAQAQRAFDVINQAERQLATGSDRHPEPTHDREGHRSTSPSSAGPRQANHSRGSHAVPASEQGDLAAIAPAEADSSLRTVATRSARASTRTTDWQAEAG
jgi:hypothetical protein